VSLQADYEKQVLHHLPHFQLGSFNDVFAVNFNEQLIFLVARFICILHMARVGNLRIHIPRKILGKQQYGTQVLGMYR
jgi:hypothetical protein